MYENQTYDAIMARLLAAVPDTLDKREGSFIWDALSPAALELAQAYVRLEYQLQRAFATTATGEDLDMRTAEQGIARKPATRAVGSLTFTGADGAIIPAKSLVASTAGIQFETVAEAVIDGGQVIANAQAVKAGVSGNASANSITVMSVSLNGVTGVNNSDPFTGGYKEETDEELRKRYFEKIQTPATSGNKFHYIAWSKEVPGVGDAKCFPLWDGNGTVKVVIVNAEKHAADAGLINAVENKIEEKRPIGAAVTVISAMEKSINVSATVTLANGYTIVQVQTLYEKAITDYLNSIAFADTCVSYAQLGKMLLETAGVGDYANLLINGSINNIILGDEETPVLGIISLGV